MQRLIVMVFILAGMPLPASAATPCCIVTGVDIRTGVLAAQERATGRTFQFKVPNATLLKTLHAGSPLYANFSAMQVSLDGKTACCEIVRASGAAPPAKVGVDRASTDMSQAIAGSISKFDAGRSTPAAGGSAPAGTNSGASGGTASAQSCPSGYSICGNVCVELSGDGHHCGACGNACGQGRMCSSGNCVASSPSGCPAGQNYCGTGAGCFNLATDPHQCGSCGSSCAANQTCSNGRCNNN